MQKKLFVKIIKITCIALLSLVALVFIFLTGVNIFKYFYYDEYFSVMTKVAKTEGLAQGFVPQGITYFDNSNYVHQFSGGAFVSTGYMSNGKSSRIYVVDEESGEHSFFNLSSGGQAFYGHTGGIQYEDGYFYLANDGSGIYKFSCDFIFNSESGTNVEIGYPLPLINHASFIFSQPGFLYVGEFNNDAKYSCTNSISYNGIDHRAVVTKYNIDDLFVTGKAPVPVAVYSIPNEIQGFCITDNGSIVLSRSNSVSNSNFFVYSLDHIISTGQLYCGAPVYFLADPSDNIIGPAMSEDLDLYNGNVITIFESACNKYFFGKLFFANYIASLEL